MIPTQWLGLLFILPLLLLGAVAMAAVEPERRPWWRRFAIALAGLLLFLAVVASAGFGMFLFLGGMP